MVKSELADWPKVSIIIPVYNGSDFLAEAIESALAQTYCNIEILVVNDGSSDGGASERVALSYGDRIRYLSKNNGGVASALNLGISEMSGDYFSWLSHDDLYVPEKISKQVEFLLNLPSEIRHEIIVYSDYAIFSNDPNQLTPVAMRAVESKNFRYWITTENSLHGCTLLVPRKAFEDIGVFDERLRTTQDYDLWFRMATKYRFMHFGGFLVKARSHEKQGTVSMPATVQAEGNELMLMFATELSEEELLRGGRQDLVVVYARIACSFWFRGFAKAAKQVTKRIFIYRRQSSISSFANAIGILFFGVLGFYVMKPMRRCVPIGVRAYLRQRLRRPTGSAVLPSPGSLRSLSLKDRFSKIYTDNIFRGEVSRSGAGSDLVQTSQIRRELPRLLREYEVRTMLDAPCGDWFWMREVDLPIEKYIGVDIVESLIRKNAQDYGNYKNIFVCRDLASENLPESDLILSRDCLVHLTFHDALNVISNFKKSGAKYLLTTTFIDRDRNEDLGKGFWRVLNMQLSPFCFPEPIKLIRENCTENGGVYADKCLGLWSLRDINVGS